MSNVRLLKYTQNIRERNTEKETQREKELRENENVSPRKRKAWNGGGRLLRKPQAQRFRLHKQANTNLHAHESTEDAGPRCVLTARVLSHAHVHFQGQP